MPHIKDLATGEVFAVSGEPQWVSGIWECGDRRFTDQRRTEYAVFVPVPPAPVYPALEPIDFYLAFTPQERIEIKASADPVVLEFWDTYQRAERNNKPINPNSPAVQQGLAYLAQPTTGTPPGAGILAPGRVAQILVGAPQ